MFFLKHLSGILTLDWLITPGSFSLYIAQATRYGPLKSPCLTLSVLVLFEQCKLCLRKKLHLEQNLLSWVCAGIKMAVSFCVSFRLKKTFVHRVLKTLTLKYEWEEMQIQRQRSAFKSSKLACCRALSQICMFLYKVKLPVNPMASI